MKKYFILLWLLFLLAGILNFTSAIIQTTMPGNFDYYTSEQKSTYWPILSQMEKGNCTAGTDFIVSIPPGGCSPSVVRSDLLEEQNVPVFCKLSAIKVNPLIQVSSIKSITFKGKKPEGVVDIQFHPAQAAIRSYESLLGSPLINNIGYVVIVLKKNKVEKDMEKWIAGNLTATIYYDIDKAYGTGQAEYYLPILTDEEWNQQFKNYGFWSGKGYLRAASIEGNNAKIGLYIDKDNQFHSVSLVEGQQSNEMFFPYSYCKAGLQVKLNKIESEEEQAKLNIDGNIIWVREKSKFLDGVCSVNKLSILPDRTGTIEIDCRNQKRITLALMPKGANIRVNNLPMKTSVGKEIAPGWKLAYAGNIPKIIGDIKSGDDEFIVIVKDEKNKLDIPYISRKISDKVYDIGNRRITGVYNSESFITEIKNIAGNNAIVLLKSKGKNEYRPDQENRIPAILFNQLLQITIDRDFSKEGDRGIVLEEYFEKSEKELNYLLEDYKDVKSDKSSLNNPAFGEQELISEIRLAKLLGKMNKMQELGAKFLELYPNSNSVQWVKDEISKANIFDLSQSQDKVLVNNAYHYISLDELKPLDKDSKKIKLWISGWKEEEISEKDTAYLTASTNDAEKEKKDYVYVDKINIDNAEVTYHHIEIKDGKRGDSVDTSTLKINQPVVNRFGVKLELKDIDLKRVAYVSLNPHIESTKSNADFTFRIGIEKRDIKLSDEKTKEMIKNLNETIKKWDEINAKLGKLIKGWKGVCFATSLTLMVKSGIAGFSGQSIARQKVMESYKQYCKTKHPEMTSTECYNKYASNINNDVSSLTNSIKVNNNNIKSWQEVECKKADGSLFSGAVIDDVCVKKKMRDELRKKYHNGKVPIPGITPLQEVNLDSIDNYDTLKVLMAEDLAYSKNSDGVAVVSNYYTQKKTQLLTPIYKQQEEEKALKTAQEQAQKTFGGFKGSVVSVDSEPTNTGLWSGQTWKEMKGTSSFTATSSLKDNDPVQPISLGGELYVVKLNSESSGRLRVGEIYKVNNNGNKNLEIIKTEKCNSQNPTSIECKLAQVKNWEFVTGGACSNPYKSPKVRFYDSGNSKGMPGIVPVNKEKGWYAKISQSPGGMFSSEVQGYKQSAEINFFYLCNVGNNGFEESMAGDDICQSIDINDYPTEFRACPGMTKTELKRLIDEAILNIKDAASKYGNGQKKMNIRGIDSEVDMPMGGENLVECQDFMSPGDCKILFNACDPVICPASRCNLRGAYPVSNVIQTGIIGSLFLCLPNIKEGVMVPICLSGIYAGIESFVSILKSERECLQRSLDTGEHVGICDEITSVYLCEFFWRQLAPVMNILIPKLIESAYGQGTRGGGEYLSVQNSWDTMQKNIDYFKNTYAQNAFRAFQFRNVEEAGGEFCKAFVGSSLPTSASALDNLLDPESPEQVYAWFSETLFTEATVPATSQYKVYFHIFAGNDNGVQFRVYLRNPPDSSYYKSTGVINVKTGYIAKGSSADEAIDFTAPSGYKELCVDMNSQTRCGFTSVSTDFALDYLSKKYTEEQATTGNIKTEKECISGSASVYSLANPNIQAGAESTINPQANLNGIVRICSTNNPGKATDTQTTTPESTAKQVVDAGGSVSGEQRVEINFKQKWQKVGICDNSNIGCWLDTESVKKDVQQIQAIDNGMTIEEMKKSLNEMSSGNAKQTEADAGNKLSEIQRNMGNYYSSLKNEINGKTAKSDIEAVINTKINADEISLNELGGQTGTSGKVAQASNNAQIAQAIALRVQLYRIVAEVLFESFKRAGEESLAQIAEAKNKIYSYSVKNNQIMRQLNGKTAEDTPFIITGIGIFIKFNSDFGNKLNLQSDLQVADIGENGNIVLRDAVLAKLYDLSELQGYIDDLMALSENYQYNGGKLVKKLSTSESESASDGGGEIDIGRELDLTPHIESINFFDKSKNEINGEIYSNSEFFMNNVFLIIGGNSECKTIKYSVWKIINDREKVVVIAKLYNPQNRISFLDIWNDILKSDNAPESSDLLFIRAFCVNDSGEEVEGSSLNSKNIRYLNSDCAVLGGSK